MKDNRNIILDYLDNKGIQYKEYSFDHDLSNMELCSEVEKDIECCIFKNLFLQNRQGTEFFLLLLSGSKKFRTAVVSKQLNKSRLSFGAEDKLMEYMRCVPGSITPFGLIFDNNNVIKVAIDKDLLNEVYIGVHPFMCDKIIKIKMEDLIDKIIKNNNREISIVDLNEE